jgi:hypothetical protein
VGALPALVSFSVAEVVIYLAVVGAPLAMAWSYRARRSRGTTRLHSARDVLLHALAVLGFVLLAFDLAWGLHYARPELARRLGLSMPAGDELGKPQLEALAGELVTATNDAY